MRKYLTAVIVGALSFSIYMTVGTGSGVTPNRDATCPVRLDPDYAADAGLGIYQRLKFPVYMTVLVDGGRDVQLPPMPLQKVRDAIQVVDWSDCTLAASTAPVMALWGSNKPFVRTGIVKPWCRQKSDAGLPCPLLDGGTFGDGNVTACVLRQDPNTCERVSTGVIILGDSPENL